MSNKIITVFGSAFVQENNAYYNDIFQVGKLLAQNGYDVCSGGYAGIMEAVSKGAKSVNGKTIGVTVSTWTSKPNQYIDEDVKMPNLMERITELITLADAYVIFKGGTGTLVELSVALELMNKKAMPEKPIILFGSFWSNLIEILKQDSDKLAELINRNIRFAESPVDVVNHLNKY
jgi:uncharacterized protein (TIGR00730 family)